nr:titin-like [Crassostrea gigas]
MLRFLLQEEEIIIEKRETIDKKPQEISSVDTIAMAEEGTKEKTLDSSTDTKSADVVFAETMEILPKEDESLTTETTTKSIVIQPESSPVSLDIDISIPKNETEVSRLETTVVQEVVDTEEIIEEQVDKEEDVPSTETFKQTVEILPESHSVDDITQEIPPEKTEEETSNVEVPAPEEEIITEERETIDKKPQEISSVDTITITKEGTEEKTLDSSTNTKSADVVFAETMEILPKEDESLTTETTTNSIDILPESSPVSLDIDISIPKSETEVSRLETTVVQEVVDTEEIIEEQEDQEEDVPSTETFKQTVEILPESHPVDDVTPETALEISLEKTEEETSNVEVPAPEKEIITEERETIDKKPQEISSVDTSDIAKEGTEEKTLDSSTDTKSADVVFAETMEILPKEDESLTTETTTKDIVIQPETSQVSLDIDISIPKDETEVSRLETTVVQEVVDTEEIIEEQEDQEEDVPSTETYKETVEILPEKPSIETSVDDILQNTLEKAETTEKEIEAPLVVEVIEERQQIKETSISDQNLFVSEMFAPNEELISEEKEAVQEIPEKVCTHIEVSQVAIQPSDEGFETVERLTEIDANKPDIKILPENKEELSTTEKLIFDTKESTTELEEENIKDIELDIEVQAPMQDVNEQTYETLALNEKKKTFTNEEIFDEISAGEIKPALEDSLEISSVDNIPSGEVSYKSPTLNSDEQLLLAETPEDMKFSSEETTAISCEQQESIMPVSVKEKQESITSEHFVEKPIEEGVKEVKEDIKDVVREDKAPVPSDKVLVSQQKESVSYPNETEVSELEVEDITQILPKESKAEVMPDVKSVASIGKQEMEITELVLKSREETYEEESWEVEEEKVEELVETNPEEQIVMNAETSTQTIESKIDIMESVDTLDSITIQTFAENFSKDVIKTVLMQETEISKITSEEAPQDVLESDVQESKPTHVSGSSVIPENLAEVLPQYDEETTVVSTVQQNIETPLFEENLPFDSVQNKEESGEVKMAEQLTDATEATEMPISEISLPCDSVDVIKEIKQEDIAQSNEIKISEENVTADDKKEMQSVPIKNEETLETVEITDAETEITAIADKVEQKLVTPVLEITADLDTYEMIEEEHLTAQESFVGTHEDEKTSESSKDESHVKSCKSHLIHLCLKI